MSLYRSQSGFHIWTILFYFLLRKSARAQLIPFKLFFTELLVVFCCLLSFNFTLYSFNSLTLLKDLLSLWYWLQPFLFCFIFGFFFLNVKNIGRASVFKSDKRPKHAHCMCERAVTLPSRQQGGRCCCHHSHWGKHSFGDHRHQQERGWSTPESLQHQPPRHAPLLLRCHHSVSEYIYVQYICVEQHEYHISIHRDR